MIDTEAKANGSDSIMTQTKADTRVAARFRLILMEAAVGIEPTNKGFAGTLAGVAPDFCIGATTNSSVDCEVS